MAAEKIADWVKKTLSEVESLIVYVNSTKTGVRAPAAQLAKPSFSLSLSHFYDRPVLFSDNEVKADLLFERSFFTCIIPWESIWAAHPDAEPGLVCFWNENSPGPGWDAALLQYLKVKPQELSQQTGNDQTKSPEVAKPKLSLAQGQDPLSEKAAPKNKPKKVRKTKLKLVKK